MNYDEFVTLRRKNEIFLGIGRSHAIQLTRLLPPLQSAVNVGFLSIALLSIPGFICVAFFWKWWAGLLMLVLLTPWLFGRYKAFSVYQILSVAECDREFYETLNSLGVLSFEDCFGNRFGGIYDQIRDREEHSL